MPPELNDRRVFARKRAGGLLWEVRVGADIPGLERILADPDAAFAGAATILKRGRSGTVALVPPLVVKRFDQKRPLNRVFDRFRPDRARRNLARSVLLESLGIPTPRALAAAPRLRFGLVACSYLVMEELSGARTLGDRLREGVEPGTLEEVGAILARLHAAGWSHRDLKATNVLVDASGAPHLVDLDGIARRRLTVGRRASDLGRLFRDISSDPARSKGWIDAVFAGYRRHASEGTAAAVRVRLGFAGVEAAWDNP